MAEINRLYGKALYDLVVQHGKLEACLDQAAQIRDALKQSESQQILTNPLISKAEKIRFLNKVHFGTIKEPIEAPLGAFWELLIDKNREGILVSSLTEFLRLGDRWRGIVEAHVVSATDLRPEQVSALHELLTRKLRKTVDMTVSLDPSLIGGFYLNVDGHTVDSSVRRRLQDMKRSIERGEGFDGPQT